MAITKSLLNQDTYFRITTGDKIIINDLSYYDIKDIEHINKQLMTVYNKQTFSTVASCDCGETKGTYNKGHVCLSCSTTCVDPKDKVEPLLWFKALSPKLKFINPFFWSQFRDLISTKFDYLRWMCDVRYNPPTTPPKYLIGVKDILGGVRDYSVFLERIEEIITYFINHSSFKAHDKNLAFRELLEDYRTNKKDILSEYLSVVNKKVFVMENTPMGKYTNLSVGENIDTVMMWVKTVSDVDRITDKKRATATVNVISKLSGMYSDYYDKYLFKKEGALRKHSIAARSFFTFRGVITSIPGRHNYDDLYLPWSIGVTTFRPHLLNKLVNNEKFTYKAASRLLFGHVNKYHPLLDKLLKELINETPGALKGTPGILTLFTRNPSLLIGSILLLNIVKIKTDPNDKTISMSYRVVGSQNGDFDGDALNGYPLMDSTMESYFQKLKVHYSIPDLSKPYSVSGNLSLFSPSNNIIANFLSDKVEQPELDTVMHLL